MKGQVSKLSSKLLAFKECVGSFCVENACHCVALRYLRFRCSNILLSVSLSVCFRVHPLFILRFLFI